MIKRDKPSNKFRRIPTLTKIICEALDTQEVRRLCRYYSLSPYDKVALDYNNELVEQPDLVDSTLEESVRDKHISQGTSKPCVLPYRFSKEALTDNRVIIFVYCHDIDLRDTTIDVDTIFSVDIVYPLENEKLENFGSRAWEIVAQLSDMLDEYRVAGDYAKQIGNVEFRFASKVISGKLANNSSMGIISVPIHVKSIGLNPNRY